MTKSIQKGTFTFLKISNNISLWRERDQREIFGLFFYKIFKEKGVIEYVKINF